MSKEDDIKGLQLIIRSLEAEYAWRESALVLEKHLRELEPDFPTPKMEWLDRMAVVRACLAQNRAELELLQPAAP